MYNFTNNKYTEIGTLNSSSGSCQLNLDFCIQFHIHCIIIIVVVAVNIISSRSIINKYF